MKSLVDQRFYEPWRHSVEQDILAELKLDEPWALIEHFSGLVRESGSGAEREAARYICSRLDTLGVPYRVYEPELFLSVPVSASLAWKGQRYRAKTPSFSTSTDALEGDVVYIPGDHPRGVSRLFHFERMSSTDVHGKIVLTEGYAFPEAVYYFERQGALGQIYINPGVDRHWGICTTIWGAPDLDTAYRQPATPVVVINRPDGEALKDQLRQERIRVTLQTELTQGWIECPLIVAEIEGQEEPERFMLVHGHYDSWDVGIGDNAVGNATLLELARVYQQQRLSLARSLRIAWWPGHSTGRYAGSTWYADVFGMEMARDCIAQVNIDSPGCRWATEYYGISWMKEAEDFCIRLIGDVTGKEAQGERPHQAGDYSFNNIGVSGFFMLLSTMPKELLAEKGYYPTGGCGGNIAWHTENDTLKIADRDNLLRDLRVYAAAIQRVLNNPVHPFDFRNLTEEFRETLTRYAEAPDVKVDFRPCVDALKRLDNRLGQLYAKLPGLLLKAPSHVEVRRFNDVLLELSRTLVPINYTRYGLFRHDPAVPIAPLPDLAPALELSGADPHGRRVISTHLQRGVNRVSWAFQRADKALRALIDA